MLDVRSIASELSISTMTVNCILSKFITSGTVEKIDQIGRPTQSSMHPLGQLVLLDSILDKTSITQNEITQEIEQSTGSHYHQSTISRTIRHFGFTRKRVLVLILLKRETILNITSSRHYF